MISAFFIDRPRFAIVISLVITISGLVSYMALPIERFPDLAPPTVIVEATYPGAGPDVVEETVTAPIEQEINGVKNMIYMSSVSSSDGKARITIYFETGTDIDIATVQVQNRVQQAMAKLPEEVRRQGVTTKESSPNMLMVVHVYAEDEKMADEIFLGNYMTINLKDPIARVKGVGRVEMLGARDYGMRAWLNPTRLKNLEMSPEEVAAALAEQNAQIPGGRVGAPPVLPDQRFQFNIELRGRMNKIEDYEKVIIRANPDGSMVRLKDVARVELGAQNYDIEAKLDGQPCGALMVYQTPGSNALETAAGVKATLENLERSFPSGVTYEITYDYTEFISVSMAEMMETLYMAVALVVLVVFIFLSSLRATVVPAIAVPVALIGTFLAMAMAGFSVNSLSLFGLILAIGIVVDDAILVVETSTRNIEEGGMNPKEAALATMREVSGAVIASTLVLLAVFVPVGFMPGLTGRLYQQFAFTISAAVLFSTINALTLSPALAALLLKPAGEPTVLKRGFDSVFNPTRKAYLGLTGGLLKRRLLSVGIYLGLLAATAYMFNIVPGGFVPTEDDGMVLINVELPDAASINRTQEVVDEINDIVHKTEPDVRRVASFAGYSILASSAGSNNAIIFLMLKPWGDRSNPEQQASAIARRVQGRLGQLQDAKVFVFQQPAIPGMGNTAGLDFELQDRGGLGSEVLQEMADTLMETVNKHPAVGRSITTLRSAVPKVFVDLNREQAKTMGVSMTAVTETLSSTLGSRYINDFPLYGRNFRVMMEGERDQVQTPDDLMQLYITNEKGEQVPLSAIADMQQRVGPDRINRFNLFPSARITLLPAPGRSSGEVIQAMEMVSSQLLPPEMGYEWSGSAREEKAAGSAAIFIFGLAILFCYLFLVAQYESWNIPLAVMMVIPISMVGAAGAQFLRGLSIDVYTQVGLVLLIGLVAKTAILLVEVAKQRNEDGESPAEAAQKAAALRFRAVLMTALTFIFGMIPLVVASGAGAASRQSLGTAVTGGMITGILFTLTLVPVAYLFVGRRQK